MNSKFVDAQEMARLYPETFDAPWLSELEKLKPSDWVKVCINNDERFWCRVDTIDGDRIFGIIDNNLICTDSHGLKYGDTISFNKNNIYAIHFLN